MERKYYIHSILSSLFVFTTLYFYLYLCSFDIQIFFKWYGCSWLVFSWWLVTVTYLQHHDDKLEDTIIYGDESWNFLNGALQTVDRTYNFGIDNLTHNITDGHLIHHIFFTQIPHYNLPSCN